MLQAGTNALIEAFDLYLSRLSDRGMLNMMRLEHSPARESKRSSVRRVAPRASMSGGFQRRLRRRARPLGACPAGRRRGESRPGRSRST